ncbi:MAG: hypothetical protein ACPHSE_06375 [Flavobacteriaceae bacterium]
MTLVKPVLFFLLFFGLRATAQGSDLLIQQYDRYSYDTEYYRKWNFDVFLQPHWNNTTNRKTEGRFGLNFGTNVHYQFTKTFGLSSGIHYMRTSYNYTLETDKSIDRLRFLRFPLVLSVYPVNRLRISLGGSYNWIQTATGVPPPLIDRTHYPSAVFVNTLGVLFGMHYRVFKKFSASFEYRLQKRGYRPYQRETQHFKGFSLGIHYTLLNSNRPQP